MGIQAYAITADIFVNCGLLILKQMERARGHSWVCITVLQKVIFGPVICLGISCFTLLFLLCAARGMPQVERKDYKEAWE